MVIRQAIISEAAYCFLHNDYEKVTLNHIAARIGITKGGIYHYFSSKDELLFEVIKYSVQDIYKIFHEKAFQNNSLKDILRTCFSFESILEDSPQSFYYDANYIYLLSIAAKKFPQLKDYLGEVYREYIYNLESVLKQAQKNGEIRMELDCRILATQIVAFLKGIMFIGFCDDNLSLKVLSDSLFNNFWEQIKS